MKSAWFQSRRRLAINKKQKYFSLHATNLLKTWFFFLVCEKGQKQNKGEFVTKSLGFSYDYFDVKISPKSLVKTLLHSVFFHWSLESQNCKQNNLQNILSKSLPTMGTLVEKLSSCSDYFLRLSGFTDLSGKIYIWSILNSPKLITQQCFAGAMLIFFSFIKL